MVQLNSPIRAGQTGLLRAIAAFVGGFGRFGRMAPKVKSRSQKAQITRLPMFGGDRLLAFHSCMTCGCTTHWKGVGANDPQNMAVNMAMCDENEIRDIPVRQFDGADTWEFLD